MQIRAAAALLREGGELLGHRTIGMPRTDRSRFSGSHEMRAKGEVTNSSIIHA